MRRELAGISRWIPRCWSRGSRPDIWPRLAHGLKWAYIRTGTASGAGSRVLGSNPAARMRAFHSDPWGRMCRPWSSRAARWASWWQKDFFEESVFGFFEEGGEADEAALGIAAAEASG